MKRTKYKEDQAAVDSKGLVYKKTNDTEKPKRTDNEGRISVSSPELRYRGLLRKIFAAASLADAYFKDHEIDCQQWLITLTYRSRLDWESGQLSGFNKLLRSWASRAEIPIVGLWVLELQKRGAPHYHIVLYLPRGMTPPRPDQGGRWKYGFAKQKKVNNGIPYILKPSSKLKGGDFPIPRGARMYGHFGLDKASREMLKYQCYPQWLKDLTESSDKLVRLAGGRWLNRTRFEIYKTAWQFAGVSRDGIVSFERIRDKPQVIKIGLIAAYLTYVFWKYSRRGIMDNIPTFNLFRFHKDALARWQIAFT